MLLSKITTDPKQFQKRERPYSEKTVKAIISEGLRPAKFDPLPLFPVLGVAGVYCVGGDGHSRLEAIHRLAKAGRMPKAWAAADGDYEIPAKVIDQDDAKRLAWTSNLSRDNFTPSEEARVYQEAIDDGMTHAEVAAMAHTSEHHVMKMLPLNSLCRDIRAAIGASPAAGGIDVMTAQMLAAGFTKYNVGVQQQQQLWHCVLKSAMLNFQSAKKFIDRIGGRLGQKSEDGLLFALPANAVAVVAEAKERGAAARTAKTGLGLLLSAMRSGGLDAFPELEHWLTTHGEAAISKLAERVTEDAEVLANLIAPPKVFKPLPASPADARIARQYDPTATATMFAA